MHHLSPNLLKEAPKSVSLIPSSYPRTKFECMSNTTSTMPLLYSSTHFTFPTILRHRYGYFPRYMNEKTERGQLPQDHTARKWGSQDLNPGPSGSRTILAAMALYSLAPPSCSRVASHCPSTLVPTMLPPTSPTSILFSIVPGFVHVSQCLRSCWLFFFSRFIYLRESMCAHEHVQVWGRGR